MNYYFCGSNITDNQHLKKYISFASNVTADEFKSIIHFTGGPLKGWDKLSNLYSFCDRDIYDYVLSLKTIPEKTIQESGGKWMITEHNKVLDFNKITIHGNHEMERNPWIPDIGLLELKNGMINGNLLPCVLIKNELHPIFGLTIYGGRDFRDKIATETNWMLDSMKRYFKTLDQYKIVHKKNGKGLLLFSTWSVHNYCHFLLDTLSRLDVLKSLNLNLNDYDWVCLPKANFKIFKDIIKKLNINQEKIIYLDYTDNINYQFDALHIPSLNGRIQIYSENAFKELRKLFDVQDSNPSCYRKIYLKRPKSRRSFHNSEEVECTHLTEEAE